MRDWKAIAQSHQLKLTQPDIDRIADPLTVLDETFQPLLKGLTPGLEPDPELHLGGEE
jgi:hypothetical protein